MTLKDMKIKTFSLIEEYYPEEVGLAEDEDVLNKINGVVNQIQDDLMKYRKINAKFTKNITSESSKTLLINSEINDCYQINKIVLNPVKEYSMIDDNTLVLPDDYVGTLDIYYFKYPEKVLLNPPTTIEVEGEEEPVPYDYDEEFTFDLDDALLEIMPYGIAADLLKMDMISNYGKYFYDRYLEMKNSIDTRKTGGMIFIDGGVDI